MFEDFTISTNIAAGCELRTNNQTAGVCAYTVKFGKETTNFFLESIAACTTVESDGEYDGFCYHTPSEGNNIFAS